MDGVSAVRRGQAERCGAFPELIRGREDAQEEGFREIPKLWEAGDLGSGAPDVSEDLGLVAGSLRVRHQQEIVRDGTKGARGLVAHPSVKGRRVARRGHLRPAGNLAATIAGDALILGEGFEEQALHDHLQLGEEAIKEAHFTNMIKHAHKVSRGGRREAGGEETTHESVKAAPLQGSGA